LRSVLGRGNWPSTQCEIGMILESCGEYYTETIYPTHLIGFGELQCRESLERRQELLDSTKS